ncbi:MAG: AAA family ATPase [Dehalococcoidales bacterium]
MIPIELKMRNFMCYRDNVPALHFEGIHTACLSGDNGNGKSALIDAMTWALWGQARARSDDDLIHTGQREMEVEFDFAVDEQPYRIIRKRSKPKRQSSAGQSILEFQMASGDGFRSITGNSIAQTQQKITSTLHMDYDTFINSAFLRQGRADEFTTKRPTERKEVLANILGLAFYDELEGQAKELAKQQGDEKNLLESTIGEIDNELAQKPIYDAELEQAQQVLSQMEKITEEKEARLNELRQQKEALEKKKVQLDQLEANVRDRTTSLKVLDEQVNQLQSRIKEYEALIAQRATIEAGYLRFAETKKLSDELEQKFRQSVNLERQKSLLESRIKEAGQSLNTEHTVIQNRIGELEAKSLKLPQLKSQLQQLQAQLGQLGEQEETLRQKKQSSQELQTKVNYLESNQTQLEQEIKELGEKIELLSTQTEAKCPLCETELGAEGLKLIESKYTAERQDKAASLQSNQAELVQKKTELESLKTQFSQLETQLNQDKISTQSKAGILNKEVAEAEEADKQLAEERSRLSEIEQCLVKRDFAASEQEALKELEGELARLDYSSEQHEQVRNQLTSLEHYEEPKRKLDEADRLINQEREAAARAEAATQELRRSLEVDNQKRQELSVELASLPQLVSDITQAETEYQALDLQQKQAQEALWNVKAKLQHCTELEIRKKEKEKLLAQSAKQESIYKELAKAFGKGGIQALLIEMALPEIEIEANRLLGRMTDNRMHVKFETQRETKKGDVIETLDITISDELGTRNYEMFSGGEAFRINFAIRIALSRILARRAGAPLPTLIIDEGFGTQDSTGIEKLKEAINSIQEDFDKILVITHIEELRDAFPTRIDVIKTSEGSTLSVS